MGRAAKGNLLGRVLGRIVFLVIIALGCGGLGALAPARAAPERAEPGPVSSASTAAKLQTLTNLLGDPDIQALLARRSGGGVEEKPAETPPNTMAVTLADRLQGFRQHLIALATAMMTLPADAEMARSMVAAALDKRGWTTVSAFFVGFVALGFGAEWLFRAATRPAFHWLVGLTLDTVSERVRAVFARLAYGLGLVAFFTLGSVGAFLLFDWPIVVKEILLGYLIAFLMARVFAVIGRIMLAPAAERFRVVPVSTPAATFLFRRWIALAAIIGFGWQTLSLFERFGLMAQASELGGDALGLLVLSLGLDVVWRTPRTRLDETAEPTFVERHRAAMATTASAILLVLWMLWVIQALKIFWLGIFLTGLPLSIMLARRSVNHILRPAGLQVSASEARTLDVIVFEKGVRGLILVAAALLLARIFDVDFVSLTMVDTLTTRIVRGLVSIVVIGLATDFVWNVLKALVDRKIAASLAHSGSAEDAGHAARLQTLLPIIMNILRIVIIGVAGMMMLSAAGIEIGPLIASAGVVGVAIGFGAQTLVKDIISGIFYLFDDAFRIGEYIQSGSYKGTVESFSLRSIKLRHQRGALYTVPFGILGAVQNQSRDWVVDKIVLNVPYGTDLDKVRKLIKRIGEELCQDEDYGEDILNPLKLQGVVQFGDYAIQIQTKMMTKPGDAQFLARRRALLMINKAFIENGIGFAMPMVHVAGNGEVAGRSDMAAAAMKGLELVKAAKPS